MRSGEGCTGTDSYSIAQLVANLRGVSNETKDEHEILTRARPLAYRAALVKDSWLKSHMYETYQKQGFGVHLLQEQPDHTLAIFAVSWLPDRGTPPYDHGTWAVVAEIDGPE